MTKFQRGYNYLCGAEAKSTLSGIFLSKRKLAVAATATFDPLMKTLKTFLRPILQIWRIQKDLKILHDSELPGLVT